MRRRRFNHLVAELSELADRSIDRYALWLRLHELGLQTAGRETGIDRDLRQFGNPECGRH